MNRQISKTIIAGLITLWLSSAVSAGELVYTPVNPSFGGNPLNGSWLLSQAQLQDDTEAPSSDDDDTLSDFEDTLTRQVLYQLSRRIVSSAFGDYDDELSSGHYDFGDYSIDIDTSSGSGIGVTIIDTMSGSTTTVEVPYY